MRQRRDLPPRNTAHGTLMRICLEGCRTNRATLRLGKSLPPLGYHVLLRAFIGCCQLSSAITTINFPVRTCRPPWTSSAPGIREVLAASATRSSHEGLNRETLIHQLDRLLDAKAACSSAIGSSDVRARVTRLLKKNRSETAESVASHIARETTRPVVDARTPSSLPNVPAL